MSRGLPYATIRLILLASIAGASPLFAQQAGPADPNVRPPPADAIGPPQLRNFDLQGPRVVPAQPQTAPAPVQPAPARPASPRPAPTLGVPPAATAPAPKVNAPVIRLDGRPPVAQPAPAVTPRAEAPPSPIVPEPAVGAPEPAATMPAPLPAPPVATPEPDWDLTPAPAPQPEPAGFGFSWTYAAALAAAVALLSLLLFGMRKRRNRLAAQTGYRIAHAEPAPQARTFAPPPEPAPVAPQDALQLGKDWEVAPPPAEPDVPAFLVRRAEPEAAPPPQPAEATAPEPEGIVGIQIRPWLELQFKPDRASATLTEAAVQFELVVANTGNAVASDVRIAAQMFNAGPLLEQEVERFFATPIPNGANGVPAAIGPRQAANLRSVVTMPKESVREIEVNGRRLFIPTVAINVCYEWGNGRKGRTSMSFIVGREPETPSSRMSPFRLDQGPRIYRQVGQRPSQPAVHV